MFNSIAAGIGVLAALAAGLVFGYLIRKQLVKNRLDSVEAKIEKLIADAKTKQKEILLSAQDKALKVIEDSKVEAKQSKQEVEMAKRRLEKRESLFDQKILDLENKKQELLEKAEKVN
ncbi:MAG: Rnase Y domain-containing protein, partial [Patescibacteria group bacterium]